MSQKLTGKVAIATGASKGIGASIALHLAAEGASVVVNYSTSREGADRVVAEITGKGGKAVAVQANVAKPADVTRLFAETKKALGKLDILVNNAGIYEFVPLDAITPEHFHKMFDPNVLGLLLASQEAVTMFGPDGGSIVNISVRCCHRRAGHDVGLQRHQGGRGCDYALACQRIGPTQDSRQLGQPWDGRNRRDDELGHHPGRERL